MFSLKDVMQRSILYGLSSQGVCYDVMAWFPIYVQGRIGSGIECARRKALKAASVLLHSAKILFRSWRNFAQKVVLSSGLPTNT